MPTAEYANHPMVERPCRHCGEAIQTTDPRKVFCDRKCKGKWQKVEARVRMAPDIAAKQAAKAEAKRAERERLIIEHPCDFCGETFRTNQPRRRFCNDKCAGRYKKSLYRGTRWDAPPVPRDRVPRNPSHIGRSTQKISIRHPKPDEVPALREWPPKLAVPQPVKVRLSPERAAELAAGRGGTMPANRRRDAQSGSVYSRMTTDEQRAFRKWLERDGADRRVMEFGLKWMAGLGKVA